MKSLNTMIDQVGRCRQPGRGAGPVGLGVDSRQIVSAERRGRWGRAGGWLWSARTRASGGNAFRRAAGRARPRGGRVENSRRLPPPSRSSWCHRSPGAVDAQRRRPSMRTDGRLTRLPRGRASRAGRDAVIAGPGARPASAGPTIAHASGTAHAWPRPRARRCGGCRPRPGSIGSATGFGLSRRLSRTARVPRARTATRA